MGEDTIAARAAVLAARGSLDEELERLEASARAAVDIPGRVRRKPVQTAGLAAGAGFLLVGGPAKVLRRARRAVFGPSEPLPKSMLPKEIDKTLRSMGEDGEKVRGTIEREFARYLEEKAPERRERDLGAVTAALLATVSKPVVSRLARRLVEDLFAPDAPGFGQQIDAIRARRSPAKDPAAPAGSNSATAIATGTTKPRP